MGVIWKVLALLAAFIGALIGLWHGYRKLPKTDPSKVRTLKFCGWMTCALFVGLVFNFHALYSEHEEKKFAQRQAWTNAEDVRMERLLSHSNQIFMLAEFKRLNEQNFAKYKPELEKRYGIGYTIFSVVGTVISPEMSSIDRNIFVAQWETARIVQLTDKAVAFRTPRMMLPGHMYNEGNTIALDRKAGAAYPLVGFPGRGIGVFVEVLQDHPMGVTMVLGLKNDPVLRDMPPSTRPR